VFGSSGVPQEVKTAAGAVEAVVKPKRFMRRLFQAVVGIINQKLPKASLADFHNCGSFHSALRARRFGSEYCPFKKEKPQVATWG